MRFKINLLFAIHMTSGSEQVLLNCTCMNHADSDIPTGPTWYAMTSILFLLGVSARLGLRKYRELPNVIIYESYYLLTIILDDAYNVFMNL